MARLESLNVLHATGDQKALADEVFGWIVSNISKVNLSTHLKYHDYSKVPGATSIIVKRTPMDELHDYGTARAEGKGNPLRFEEIEVSINDHKEIVQEYEKFDVQTVSGLAQALARKAPESVDRIAMYLDKRFFDEAAKEGSILTIDGEVNVNNILESIGNAITTLEVTMTKYTYGVPRHMMAFVLHPSKYEIVRTAVDGRPNPNITTAADEFFMYHGVRFYSSISVPKEVVGILLTEGCIAQPVTLDGFEEPKELPLSKAVYNIAVVHNGIKVIAPERIIVLKSE